MYRLFIKFRLYTILYSNGDNFLFRPQDNDFYDIYTIKTKLSNTTPKED